MNDFMNNHDSITNMMRFISTDDIIKYLSSSKSLIAFEVPQIVLYRSIDEAFEANDSLKDSVYFYSKFVEMLIDDDHDYDKTDNHDEKYCYLENVKDDNDEQYVVVKTCGNKNNLKRRLEQIKELNYEKGVFMITKIPKGKLSISDLISVKTCIRNIRCCFGIYMDSKGRSVHTKYFKKIQLVTKRVLSSTDYVIQRYSPKRDFTLIHMAVDSCSEYDLPCTATVFPSVCATCYEKKCHYCYEFYYDEEHDGFICDNCVNGDNDSENEFLW